MNSFRRAALAASLLCGLAAGAQRPETTRPPSPEPQPGSSMDPKALPEVNSVSALSVRRGTQGLWEVQFDYAYTGQPLGPVFVSVEALRAGDSPTSAYRPSGSALMRGQHRQRVVPIDRPYAEAAFVTQKVVVSLRLASGEVVAQATTDAVIQWPDLQGWAIDREMATLSADAMLTKAVGMIDSGQGRQLRDAQARLERLLERDPRFPPAYIELARVAMKTNWGPEGLKQAENLLRSALQIRPGDANAQILLGYVHTHQARYPQAEALFAEAARSRPSNLWLWANWGELLVKRDQVPAAIAKYREAIDRPPTGDTYDRAREDAYDKLMDLHARRREFDAIEALHQRRTADYGGCHGLDYGRFVLGTRGDAARAIELVRPALSMQCKDAAREVMGMAHYLAWSEASGSRRDDLLNQARVYAPAGATLLYGLAAHERTAGVVKQLIASGENVDLLDNARMTALAHALQDQDHDAARRLLRLGARTDTPVGPSAMPAALLPVALGDLKGIRLMRQFGVDYGKLRYQGSTALEHARRLGDRKLIEALDPKSGAT